MAMHIISVDLQNEFCTEGGALYHPRSSVSFITEILLPFVRDRGYRIAEIVSDYRANEPGVSASSCVPGQWGYQSIIPSDLKYPSVWVKAEPSPAWTRPGAGQADQPPGQPYPAPDAFSAWLLTTIGAAADQQIILVGLMLEICVLSTLQELKYRGYRVKVLSEGVDTYSGSVEQKQLLFGTLFPFWGQALSWAQMQEVSAQSEHGRVPAQR
ncbi:MAG: isochorismatase family protein [Caldilineaceae bacterium]